MEVLFALFLLVALIFVGVILQKVAGFDGPPMDPTDRCYRGRCDGDLAP